MANGEAEDDEARLLTNLESTVLIYDLMMEGIIEEKGCWNDNGNPSSMKNHMKTLVETIGNRPKFNKDQIYHILGDAVHKKNLIYHELNGKIEWRWLDFI